jgi:hypothetical protein
MPGGIYALIRVAKFSKVKLEFQTQNKQCFGCQYMSHDNWDILVLKKVFTVYLKFKFNWIAYILTDNPPEESQKKEDLARQVVTGDHGRDQSLEPGPGEVSSHSQAVLGGEAMGISIHPITPPLTLRDLSIHSSSLSSQEQGQILRTGTNPFSPG